MPDERPNLLSPAQERQKALSRWDNEGGVDLAVGGAGKKIAHLTVMS